jgi:hypothetical protein
METFLSVWRNGTARGAIILVSMMFVIRCFPSNGIKVVSAMFVLYFATNLYVEWREYFRPTRTLYAIHIIRTKRFLKRLRRTPPDVPFIYGFAFMLMLIWIALASFIKPGAFVVPVVSVFQWTVGVGSLRQGSVAIRTVAKLTWSRVSGKAIYGGALFIAIWLGRGDAAATVRELTHADAKYFPTFIGVMAGPYAVLHMMQLGSILIIFCALLLFLASWPRMISRTYQSVKRHWDSGAGAGRSEMLSDAMTFFTPIGLMVVGVKLVTLPALGITEIKKYDIPAFILAKTEYVADGACANLPANVETQHLSNDRVSVLGASGSALTFSKTICTPSP